MPSMPVVMTLLDVATRWHSVADVLKQVLHLHQLIGERRDSYLLRQQSRAHLHIARACWKICGLVIAGPMRVDVRPNTGESAGPCSLSDARTTSCAARSS
jgi:hypothetical protein